MPPNRVARLRQIWKWTCEVSWSSIRHMLILVLLVAPVYLVIHMIRDNSVPDWLVWIGNHVTTLAILVFFIVVFMAVALLYPVQKSTTEQSKDLDSNES